jgi:hypothetical protein
MVCYTLFMDANPRLKHRTLQLDITDCSLDTAIRELLAVKKSLHGLHVNTAETSVSIDEHFEPCQPVPSLRINLEYTSAMTAEELAAEQDVADKQRAYRLADYQRLHKEFGENS